MKLIFTILILAVMTSITYGETVNDNRVKIREYPFLNMDALDYGNKGDEIIVLLRSDFMQKIDGASKY